MSNDVICPALKLKCARLCPGKKPLSSMSPTVVLYEGRLRAVVGASGGPLIVSSVFQTLARCAQPHVAGDRLGLSSVRYCANAAGFALQGYGKHVLARYQCGWHT